MMSIGKILKTDAFSSRGSCTILLLQVVYVSLIYVDIMNEIAKYGYVVSIHTKGGIAWLVR